MRVYVLGVLLALLGLSSAAYLDLPVAFCEHYVECEAVSRLEERLCIGNTRVMPFWLPPLSRSPSKTRCYHLLKPEYEKLDRLERQFESQLLACMTEQVMPLTSKDQETCDKILLKRAPKFSFANRSLDYIPTNCFQGKKRIDRQCGKLRSCCSSYTTCTGAVANSHLSLAINNLKSAIREIGRTCDLGLDVRAGRQPVLSSYDEGEGSRKQPTGNITVTVHHDGGVASDQLPIQREGYIRVRFHQPPKDHGKDEPLGQVSNPVLLKNETFTKVTFSKRPVTVGRDPENTKLTENEGSLTFESAQTRHSPKKYEATTFKPVEKKQGQGQGQTKTAAKEKPIIEGPAGLRQLGEHLNKLVIQSAGRPVLSKGIPTENVHDSVETASQEQLIDNSLSELNKIEETRPEAEISADISGAPVTSGAIVIVSERTTQAVRTSNGATTPATPRKRPKYARGCGRRRLAGVKTAESVDSINSILSEAQDIPEEDANELRGLFETWYTAIKQRLHEAKQNSTAPLITEAYDHVLEKLDKMSDKFFGQLNATAFDESDYPEGDADISNTICDPTAIDGETKVNKTADSSGVDSSSVEKQADMGLMIHKTDGLNEVTKWDNAEYKKEIQEFRQMSARHRNAMSKEEDRTLTKCDHFLRCRHQVTTMLDKCSELQGHQSAIFQSTESLLNIDEDPCNGENYEDINQLYEMVIARNSKLRKCLRKEEIALIGEKDTTCATLVNLKDDTDEIVKAFMNTTYDSSVACYDTVNLIQQRCFQLRDCCPNFESCRESSHDSENERNILEKTAIINANNHRCVREQMRDTLAKMMVDVLQPGAKKITLKQKLEGKLKLKKDVDIEAEASVDVDPIIDIVDKWYPLDE